MIDWFEVQNLLENYLRKKEQDQASAENNYENKFEKRDYRIYNILKKKSQNLRSMKDHDKKRPGWELAYGKKKRSTA